MIIGFGLPASNALNTGLWISQRGAVIFLYFWVALLAINNPDLVSILLFLLEGTAPGIKISLFILTMIIAPALQSWHHDP
jgi:hypothetical protein